MARQIIVLDISQAEDGVKVVRAVFWFAIAAAKQYPKPTFQSAIDPVLAGGGAVTAPELASLQSGATVEEVKNVPYSASTSNATIKADLQQRYSDRAAAIAALPNPIVFYGVSFDGTAWSA